MKNKIGITLFVLYVLQAVLNIKWVYLENLQHIEVYKKWSGLVLILLILSQWYLSVLRMKNKFNVDTFIEIHKWVGVILPIAFYFHSTSLGFGILLLLSIVFLINIAIGFINTYSLLERFPKFYDAWVFSHIVLSVAVLVFAVVHIWLVYLYN